MSEKAHLIISLCVAGIQNEISSFFVFIGGDDFGPFPEPVVSLFSVLLSNESTFSFGVSIEDDSIVENLESFTVRCVFTGEPAS